MNQITVSEAAATIGVSIYSVYRWIASGELKARKLLGRKVLEEKDVLKLKAARDVNAKVKLDLAKQRVLRLENGKHRRRKKKG